MLVAKNNIKNTISKNIWRQNDTHGFSNVKLENDLLNNLLNNLLKQQVNRFICKFSKQANQLPDI